MIILCWFFYFIDHFTSPLAGKESSTVSTSKLGVWVTFYGDSFPILIVLEFEVDARVPDGGSGKGSE